MKTDLKHKWNNALAKAKMIYKISEIHAENYVAILQLNDDEGNSSGLLVINELENRVELRKYPYETLSYCDTDINGFNVTPYIITGPIDSHSFLRVGMLDITGERLLNNVYHKIEKLSNDIYYGQRYPLGQEPGVLHIFKKGKLVGSLNNPDWILCPKFAQLTVIADCKLWADQSTDSGQDSFPLTIWCVYNNKIITSSYSEITNVTCASLNNLSKLQPGALIIDRKNSSQIIADWFCLGSIGEIIDNPSKAKALGCTFL